MPAKKKSAKNTETEYQKIEVKDKDETDAQNKITEIIEGIKNKWDINSVKEDISNGVTFKGAKTFFELKTDKDKDMDISKSNTTNRGRASGKLFKRKENHLEIFEQRFIKFTLTYGVTKVAGDRVIKVREGQKDTDCHLALSIRVFARFTQGSEQNPTFHVSIGVCATTDRDWEIREYPIEDFYERDDSGNPVVDDNNFPYIDMNLNTKIKNIFTPYFKKKIKALQVVFPEIVKHFATAYEFDYKHDSKNDSIICKGTDQKEKQSLTFSIDTLSSLITVTNSNKQTYVLNPSIMTFRKKMLSGLSKIIEKNKKKHTKINLMLGFIEVAEALDCFQFEKHEEKEETGDKREHTIEKITKMDDALNCFRSRRSQNLDTKDLRTFFITSRTFLQNEEFSHLFTSFATIK